MRRLWFSIGWGVSALLLLRFARDLTVSFWGLGGPARAFVLAFVSLVITALAVAAWNVFSESAPAGGPSPRWEIALRAVVPLSLLASSLGCAGLSGAGCTRVCTILRWVGVPLLAAAALLPIRGRRLPPSAVLLVAALVLWPHCVCANAANDWWIARLGASPVCHAWSFTASLVALSALSRPRGAIASLLVCGAIVGGSLAFFVGHHFIGWPW